jgi:hypothetical protein
MLALPEFLHVHFCDFLFHGSFSDEAPDVDLPLLAGTANAAHGLHLESNGLLSSRGLHGVHYYDMVAGREICTACRILK